MAKQNALGLDDDDLLPYGCDYSHALLEEWMVAIAQ